MRKNVPAASNSGCRAKRPPPSNAPVCRLTPRCASQVRREACVQPSEPTDCPFSAGIYRPFPSPCIADFPLPDKITAETGDPHRSQKGLIWARPLGGIEYLFITPTPPPNRQSRTPLSPRTCPSFCAFCAPSFREIFRGSNLTPPAESGDPGRENDKKRQPEGSLPSGCLSYRSTARAAPFARSAYRGWTLFWVSTCSPSMCSCLLRRFSKNLTATWPNWA